MNTPMLPGMSPWAAPRVFIWARRFGETTWWNIGEGRMNDPNGNAKTILDYNRLHNGGVAQALVLDETTKPEDFARKYPEAGWLEGTYVRTWP